VRQEDRATYIRAIASLLLKDLKVECRSPYEDMTEEEIDAKIQMLLTSKITEAPVLSNFDRLIFVWLYRIAPRILDAVTIIEPRRFSGGIRRGPDRSIQRRSEPQNFSPASVADPQDGHLFGSMLPHCTQKVLPDRFSAPQASQPII
jgi:hypothetical protein